MENCKIWFERSRYHTQIIIDIRKWVEDNGGKIYCDNGVGAIVGVYVYSNGNVHWVRESRNKFNEVLHPEQDISYIFPPIFRHKKYYIRNCIESQQTAFRLGYGWGKSLKQEIDYPKQYGITLNPTKFIGLLNPNNEELGEFEKIYLIQLLITQDHGEQVKVQGPYQSESGSTGCSPIRFQGRGCKIATGQRYTGYPAKYYPRRAGISTGKIIGAVPKPSYPGRFDKAKGFEGGLGPTSQAERGAVLDGPYERIKRKYATGNSEVDF